MNKLGFEHLKTNYKKPLSTSIQGAIFPATRDACQIKAQTTLALDIDAPPMRWRDGIAGRGVKHKGTSEQE